MNPAHRSHRPHISTPSHRPVLPTYRPPTSTTKYGIRGWGQYLGETPWADSRTAVHR
jgi:hypothetical protein